MATSASATILFDGVCNLCNGFVQFVIRHDARGRFRFAALQSELGQALLAAHGQPPTAASPAGPDSVILLEGGQLYSHSTAVLRIARQLDGPWRLAAVGRLLPQRWRDAAYRLVARHRYGWFGRQESCLVPTPELRARFL
ncbi:thiol-disulfide oxidoreductase DCC family protein [Hymenobacter ginsengisoli]|uniref:Thiol-disulfide oxidoreductase DCC family protein n=1 Tax=Hymenobacter ginsengisoli TaxID=1051626 RepID=A0ABP8Q6X3_9BACT|nr:MULTISPECIES: thiol-disulfide oxidoreductase DCC family protein [unclassified Hymenobacter]MBO2031854.1 thiol-disulfide oxidoreductase DCC family protein [Hymenobacter sp. BT559]